MKKKKTKINQYKKAFDKQFKPDMSLLDINMKTKTKNIDKDLREEIFDSINSSNLFDGKWDTLENLDKLTDEIMIRFDSRLGELRKEVEKLTETGGGYDAAMEAEYAEAINDVLKLIDTLIPKEEK